MGIIAGIDYGSKLAGTTAIALLDGDVVSVLCSAKNKDADAFLKNVMEDAKPAIIGIDAPLSLPAVYNGINNNHDYFYRQCDRELKCMSPMFLGGLTARAMQMRAELTQKNIIVIETYPAKIALDLGLKTLDYKGNKEALAGCISALKSITQWNIDESQVTNWHFLDALLALYGTDKYSKGIHQTIGNPFEGLIYF